MPESVAMWKMRRIYPRLERVALRHREESFLAQRAEATLPILRRFSNAYDGLRRGPIPWAKDSQSGRAAVYELVIAARQWLPLVVRDLPFIDRANCFDSTISDDILDDTEQLISALRDGRTPDGNPLAYRENAVDQLDIALRAARLKWLDAETADTEYSRTLAELRDLATVSRAKLNEFLQAAAFTLTYLSPEYLLLLPSRAGQVEDDDDRMAPLPELVEPATLTTSLMHSLEF